jgi:hypothetical protein
MISLAIHPIIHSSAIIVLCLFNNNPETAKENRWYPNGFNWLRERDALLSASQYFQGFQRFPINISPLISPLL